MGKIIFRKKNKKSHTGFEKKNKRETLSSGETNGPFHDMEKHFQDMVKRSIIWPFWVLIDLFGYPLEDPFSDACDMTKKLATVKVGLFVTKSAD